LILRESSNHHAGLEAFNAAITLQLDLEDPFDSNGRFARGAAPGM